MNKHVKLYFSNTSRYIVCTQKRFRAIDQHEAAGILFTKNFDGGPQMNTIPEMELKHGDTYILFFVVARRVLL